MRKPPVRGANRPHTCSSFPTAPMLSRQSWHRVEPRRARTSPTVLPHWMQETPSPAGARDASLSILSLLADGRCVHSRRSCRIRRSSPLLVAMSLVARCRSSQRFRTAIMRTRPPGRQLAGEQDSPLPNWPPDQVVSRDFLRKSNCRKPPPRRAISLTGARSVLRRLLVRDGGVEKDQRALGHSVCYTKRLGA